MNKDKLEELINNKIKEAKNESTALDGHCDFAERNGRIKAYNNVLEMINNR